MKSCEAARKRPELRSALARPPDWAAHGRVPVYNRKKSVKKSTMPNSNAFEHLNRQIPPEPHTAMYVWHKYWSRKTWNVVGEFIKTYSQAGEIVLDPFAGSGVVAIEAIRHRRKVIVSDLNPAATLITEMTLRPVDLLDLRKAYEEIKVKVEKRIEDLYEIHCVNCKKPLICNSFVRVADILTEVRYPKCPHCGFRCEYAAPLFDDVVRL